MALWTRGGLGSFMAEREEARESMHGVGERLWNGDCQREMMKRLQFREIQINEDEDEDEEEEGCVYGERERKLYMWKLEMTA